MMYINIFLKSFIYILNIFKPIIYTVELQRWFSVIYGYIISRQFVKYCIKYILIYVIHVQCVYRPYMYNCIYEINKQYIL